VLQDSIKKQVGAIEKALNNTEEMKSAANAHKKRTKIRNQQWRNDFKANAKEVGTKMIQGAMTIIKGITTNILSTDECPNDALAASASSVSVSPVKAPRQKKLKNDSGFKEPKAVGKLDSLKNTLRKVRTDPAYVLDMAEKTQIWYAFQNANRPIILAPAASPSSPSTSDGEGATTDEEASTPGEPSSSWNIIHAAAAGPAAMEIESLFIDDKD
jgi:hypothetical protein